MENRPPDSVAACWGSFPNTILHFQSTLRLDLRTEIDAGARQALCRLGFERTFGIISAQNPMGLMQPPDVNACLAASLRKEVGKLQTVYRELDACSSDRTHCEHSIAIALDLEPIITLAYRYNQLGVFWFDGDVFWIFPAHSNKSPLKLPILD